MPERYREDTNVFQLSQPGTFADPLTELLRNGVRALMAQAVASELAALLSKHADKLTDDGRALLVRQGYPISASKLENELGRRAAETFESGLAKTVRWYLENRARWQTILHRGYKAERIGLQA